MKLRNDTRTTIMGRTGSGKSRFALWLLSHADFDKRPWIVIDYKRDAVFSKLIAARNATLRKLSYRPGRNEKGINVYRPSLDQDAEVESLLSSLHSRGKCGIWLDEVYTLPQTTPLRALLTQGRSKRIQMIICTQRPRDITRFCFSEADYFCLFHFNDLMDIKRAAEFMPIPRGITLARDHSSIWYDVRRDALQKVLPVGSEGRIMERIDYRYPPPEYW